MDARLQRRYWQLVREHMTSPQELAAGPKAALNTCQSFATRRPCGVFWQILIHDVTTTDSGTTCLGSPRVAESESSYVLLVHDWSKLSYKNHFSKTDQTQISHQSDVGYELYTALLVDAGNGTPMELELRCSKGVHTTRRDRPTKPVPPIWIRFFRRCWPRENWGLQRRVVHVIDREADSQADFRIWSARKNCS